LLQLSVSLVPLLNPTLLTLLTLAPLLLLLLLLLLS